MEVEEERRSVIRDGFMEMLREEFLEGNTSASEKNGAPREYKSGIWDSSGW